MGEAIVLVLVSISATYLLDYLLNRSHLKTVLEAGSSLLQTFELTCRALLDSL